MLKQSNHFIVASTLTILMLGATGAGCTGGDVLTGTWQDPDATTQLPDSVGGGPLAVDATLTFDEEAATVAMHLELSFDGLADTVDLSGTFEHDGSNLTLMFDEFVIDEASGNAASVSEEGAPCITLMGFGGAPVCFPAPQTNVYVLDGDTLSVVIDQAIAGAPVNETHLALTPVP